MSKGRSDRIAGSGDLRFYNMPSNMVEHAGDFEYYDTELGFDFVASGKISPPRNPSAEARLGQQFVGGVICDHQGPLRSSATKRGGSWVSFPEDFSHNDLLDLKEYEGVIYCGHLFEHFGHFVTESLARLWFAKVNPGLDLLFTAQRQFLSPYQASILEALGYSSDRVKIVQKPALIKNSFVPNSSFELHNFISPKYLDSFDFVLNSRDFEAAKERALTKQCSDLLYVSRLKVNPRREFGEVLIEQHVREAGSDIIYPEEHSFVDQLATYSCYNKICGVAGSGLHLTLSAPEEAEITHLCHKFHNTYRMIDHVAGHRSNFIYIGGIGRPPFRRNIGPWLLNFEAAISGMGEFLFQSGGGGVREHDAIKKEIEMEYEYCWSKSAVDWIYSKNDRESISDFADYLEKLCFRH